MSGSAQALISIIESVSQSVSQSVSDLVSEWVSQWVLYKIFSSHPLIWMCLLKINLFKVSLYLKKQTKSASLFTDTNDYLVKNTFINEKFFSTTEHRIRINLFLALLW